MGGVDIGVVGDVDVVDEFVEVWIANEEGQHYHRNILTSHQNYRVN